MKRSLAALFVLSLVPGLAFAGGPPKTVKGQIASELRTLPAAKGLKFRATAVQARYVGGSAGAFNLSASKPGPKGLPSTLYNVSGDFTAQKGAASLSNVQILEAPLQPRATFR